MKERLPRNILPADLHLWLKLPGGSPDKQQEVRRSGSLGKEEAEKGSALSGGGDTQAHRVGFPRGALQEWQFTAVTSTGSQARLLGCESELYPCNGLLVPPNSCVKN